MEENKVSEVLYLVTKISKTVKYTSPLTGQVMEVKINEAEGYLPVFKTEREANLHSQNGKFAVVPLRVIEQ